MVKSCLSVAFGLAVAATAAHAQAPSEVASAVTEAASQLKSRGKDKIMISKVLGSQVKGPSGQTYGTVDDLVIIPGGRVVAALIKPSDGGDIVPIPYTALKLGSASAKGNVVISQSLDEIRDSQATEELRAALDL